MSISERQFKLIQEAATLLVKDINLTTEEAVQLIAESLKKEMAKRSATMEALEHSAKSDRTAFVRALVHRVQLAIEGNPYWRSKNLPKTIEHFYKVMHDSWE
ncbi:MAG: hypothetical protein K8R21_10145 [Leptospira sp.]|nr:hypothetical protein [Leptospira sp.]